ncbi:universal stress protein [Desulfoferrobacter suflitae]|uniref:universal stress protein n=1 Tax=Desulfoferrobacter suflitae TaxID=2865782 RepID=UPI0021643CBD|nr:universal stress protein [Desulfoferrobacter suflitae]MCK8603153.1 universal stress protein [Desulfoferrobacter suflitae]
MQKHFLITIGDDPKFLFGVKYVAGFFKNKKNIRLDLLYIAPRFDAPDTDQDTRLQDISRGLSKIYSKMGKEALTLSAEILKDAGFSPKTITCKVMHRMQSTVKDIVEYAKLGHYQTVVLGRRSFSIFEKTFSGSVTDEIIRLRIDFPIWICRNPDARRNNVLLCVDGSEASLRAADHAAFVLDSEEDHSLVLVHVPRKESGDPERVIQDAVERLAGRIPEERIESIILKDSVPAAAILAEADKRQVAAVVVGRLGLSEKKRPAGDYIGSIPVKLLKHVTGAALWITW